MAYNESSYKNLLFGVSQQAAQDRLPGQLEAQVNMSSDLVGGLRRRASVEVLRAISLYTDLDRLKCYNTDIGGEAVAIIVDAATGNVQIVSEADGVLRAVLNSSYLVASAAASLRLVTLDDSVFLANLEKQPAATVAADQASYPNPDGCGYFYVVAGAYSKQYQVTITNRLTGASADVSYTTPNGTATEHVAQSTPEYIAAQLVTQINATWGAFGLTVSAVGSYVFVQSSTSQPTLSTSSGTAYLRASNAMSIRDAAELPARLPDPAANIIVATGASNTKVYYRYDNLRKVWTEDAAWPALQTLTQMPVRLTRDGSGVYALTSPSYERRASGDVTSNPPLHFLTAPLTGVAAFQGRLVMLSNEYVCMSASNNPLRFFRSTVSTVADNDPIEVAAQGSLTAPYEHALSFNKDLLLFSRRYQGVVPGAATVTPRTANLSVMTRYEVDTTAEPVATGRSVFFGAPRSLGYVGMHEMVPSSYADSQYVADDATAHIPRYVQGPWRFIVASSTSNIVISCAANRTELLVHEFLWSGQEKVHQAWHKWSFTWPLVGAYFSGDTLVVLFGVNGTLFMGRIDLQRGAGDLSPTVPRLDYFREVTCTVAGKLTAPDFMANGLGTNLQAFKLSGDNAYLGQAVTEFTVAVPNATFTVPEAVPGDVYVLGHKYMSTVVPTSPVIKDSKDVPITTSRAVLHRYRVSVANTGQFFYTVSDEVRDGVPVDTTPLRLYSQRLGAGMPLADTETVTLPARVDMASARLQLQTDDFYDMNVRAIEYGFRFHQRFRRA